MVRTMAPRDGARLQHGSPDRPPWRLRAFLALSTVLAVAADLAAVTRRARRGPWRIEVQEGSMAPALRPGDWLLVDPTRRRWPAPGRIVVAREPDSGTLIVKRVVAGPGQTVRAPWGEPVTLGPDEAWLLGEDAEHSVDSRRYGPVACDDLVAVVRWRYGPRGRIGRPS